MWDFVLALVHVERGQRMTEGDASVGVADRRILWLIASGEPLTMRQISESLKLEQSTVNRQVNAALKSGLLEQDLDAGSTAKVFKVSERGSKMLASDMERSFELLAAALADIPEAERDQFRRHLLTFARSYYRQAGGESLRNDQ